MNGLDGWDELAPVVDGCSVWLRKQREAPDHSRPWTYSYKPTKTHAVSVSKHAEDYLGWRVLLGDRRIATIEGLAAAIRFAEAELDRVAPLEQG